MFEPIEITCSTLIQSMRIIISKILENNFINLEFCYLVYTMVKFVRRITKLFVLVHVSELIPINSQLYVRYAFVRVGDNLTLGKNKISFGMFKSQA